jgi:hypothetical protein
MKVEILKLAMSMARTNRDYRPRIDKLFGEYGDLLEIPDLIQEVQTALRLAQKELRIVLQNAAAERKEYLQAKQTAAVILSDPAAALKWRNLQRAEEIKAMYRKLRFIRQDSAQQSGLSRIEVPTNPTDDPKKCNDWTTIDAPAEMTKYLLERNQKHFGQAQGTPFTIPPFSATIDFSASTHTSDLILTGNFDDAELNDLTTMFVTHLTNKTPLDYIESSLKEEEIMKKFAIWPEKTSTSPSGRHLGHYRSLLQREMPKDPQAPKMEESRAALSTLHSKMINIALKHGRSYKRWQKVVTIMLEKEPGNPKIHRLQVIHLYEADYNLVLALHARKVVHHAEDNHLLNNSLYGARPGRTAHDPVGLEEFVSEITRLSRKPCIKNAEDATACYDRIIPGVGNLASRAHGMHKFVALVQGHTLEEVRYHLKTKLGISTENYQHSKISPIYGTGQGSGNSPTVWLVISSILFNCYESIAHGAIFESPDRSLRLKLYRAGFVDDTASYVNRFCDNNPPSPATMIAMLTHDSQLWSDLLWTSGGALELPKCVYHYWQYKFTAEGKPFLQNGQIGPNVEIQVGDRSRSETVPAKSAYVSYRTLGYHKSPCGSQKSQYKVLKKNCDNHARIVSSSAMTRQESCAVCGPPGLRGDAVESN